VVSAEIAVALPVLLLVTWLLLSVLRLGAAQLACQDAARAAARAASRGEPATVVLDTARRAAPDGAEVRILETPPRVDVEVQARVRVALPWLLPAFTVRGRAVTDVEGPAR
jgi:hypothetical protein